MPWNINDVRVYVRDPDLVVREEVPFLDLKIELTTRRVSVWSLTTLDIPRITDRLTQGSGVQIRLGPHLLIEGFVDVIGPYHLDGETGRASVQYSGAEDLTLVGDMVAWPEPTKAHPLNQQADLHRMIDGKSEDVVIQFIRENCSTERHAEREPQSTIAGPVPIWPITVPASAERGKDVEVSGRYRPLMEIVREGFDDTALDIKVHPNSARDGFEVQVLEYVDRGLTFSMKNQNLKNVLWQDAIPEFNIMYLAVDERSMTIEDEENEEQEVRARRVRQRNVGHMNFMDWGPRNRETFDDPGDLREFDDSDPPKALGDSADATTDWATNQLRLARKDTFVQAELIPTTQSEFKEHFDLGDIVTIVPKPGVDFKEHVAHVNITASTDNGKLEIVPVTGVLGGDLTETVEEARIRMLSETVRRITK